MKELKLRRLIMILALVLLSASNVAYAVGAVGSKGPTGDKGPRGDKGPTGDKGPQGNIGATGNKGATGDRGLVGLQGKQGIQGVQGIKGPAGGAKGDTGAIGPKGDKGDTGAVGPAGAKGDKGVKGDAGSAAPATDITPPVITTTAPMVASSSNVTFTTTMSDDVELAYISRSNTPLGEFVILAEGIKDDQAEDNAYLSLGETYLKTLMAVDTSGNISKKTISITTPETGIKIGSYTPISSYSLPVGFNCLAGSNWSQGGPQDGAIVTNAKIGSYTRSWSDINGYFPYLIFQLSNIGFGVGYYEVGDPPTPLSATSFTLTSFGSSVGGTGGSYETRYTAQATSSQSVPPTLSVTINMECNVNGAGFVSGTTATFSVSLDPPA